MGRAARTAPLRAAPLGPAAAGPPAGDWEGGGAVSSGAAGGWVGGGGFGADFIFYYSFDDLHCYYCSYFYYFYSFVILTAYLTVFLFAILMVFFFPPYNLPPPPPPLFCCTFPFARPCRSLQLGRRARADGGEGGRGVAFYIFLILILFKALRRRRAKNSRCQSGIRSDGEEKGSECPPRRCIAAIRPGGARRQSEGGGEERRDAPSPIVGQRGDEGLALTAPGDSVYPGYQLGHWEENAGGSKAVFSLKSRLLVLFLICLCGYFCT